MAKMIKLDNTIDLNSLFNMTYSFDLLKQVIEGLVKSKESVEQKLALLDDKIDERDERINDLENDIINKINNIETYLNSKDKDFQIVTNKNENYNTNNINNQGGGDNNDQFNNYTNKGSVVINNVTNVISGEDNKEGNGVQEGTTKRISRGRDNLGDKVLKERLEKIEYDISELTTSSYQITQNQHKIKTQEDDIDDLKQKMLELGRTSSDHTQSIEELKVKVMDFNVYDMMKSGTGGNSDGGNPDQFIMMLKNIEGKMTKKFEFIDEKIKKSEGLISNADGNISNIKASLTLLNKHELDHMELITKLTEQLNNTDKKVDTNKEETDNETKRLQEEIDNLKKQTEEINTNLLNSINELNEKMTAELGGLSALTTDTGSKANEESNLKIFKELSKRMNDIEKQMKIFTLTFNNYNFEIIVKDIEACKNAITRKVDNSTFADLQNDVNGHNSKLEYMRENLSELLEMKRQIDEIMWIRKKVEHLSSQMSNLNHKDDSMMKDKGHLMDSNSRFVDIHFFQEFTKNYKEENEELNRRVDENKRAIDDILEKMNHKIEERELKILEAYLINKLEEFKQYNSKKFADRAETSKNVKYLDSQIRICIETSKQVNKSENWLLAKKPMDGHYCASCENYLGELTENSEQNVHWNKFPKREEGSEKLYRLGNGFSKMLHLLNIDNQGNDKGNMANVSTNMKTTADFYHNTEATPKNFNKTILPKVRKTLINKSSEMGDQHEEYIKESKSQPRIINIYKKVKNVGQNLTLDLDKNKLQELEKERAKELEELGETEKINSTENRFATEEETQIDPTTRIETQID